MLEVGVSNNSGPRQYAELPTSPRNRLSFHPRDSTWRFWRRRVTHADQKLAEQPPTVNGKYSPSIEEAVAELRALAEASAMAPCAEDSGEFDAAQILITAEIAQADLSNRLRLAVVAAAVNSAGSMAELRIAICAFTVARRGEGNSPEAVLIALKRVINVETFEPVWLLSTWNGDQLRQKITTWCIQDYFSRTECSAVI